MASYTYTAVDEQGAVRRGALDAADRSEALGRLRQMGLLPTEVEAAWSPPSRAAGRTWRPKPVRAGWLAGGVALEQLALFTRQLSTLLDAGMPLLRSLGVLQKQQPRMRGVIGGVARAIENGGSFSEALAAHPRVFDRLYLCMVQAGEVSGALAATLLRLAEFMEKNLRLRRRVAMAMVYPAAVLVVATGVVALLMTYTLPRFKEVLDGLLGTSLPAFTRFVFGLSDALAQHALLIVLLAVTAGCLMALAAQTAAGRWAVDAFKWAVPILGPIFRKVAISRFARTLGTLLGNGVPILQALALARESAGNVLLGRLIGRLHQQVKEGESLAPTLQASPIFPAIAAGMIDVGEQSGALPDMLLKIADNYDEEIDNATAAITSLLQPVIIVLLAIIVGSIVIAMFLPLIALLNGDLSSPGRAADGD